MALVDLKSNLANFRSNFVTPGVEKKNAPEASKLNIDKIPTAYSGKTKFTVQYVDRNSIFNKDGSNIKFSPSGVYLPDNFTVKKINSSKFNIDRTPTKFSPSGIYLPELFTTKKINSSKYNIDSTPAKFSPNTKYLPTKYYPEKIIPLTTSRWGRWAGPRPPAVNFFNDKDSNAKGFTIYMGNPGRTPNKISGDQSQFFSFQYDKVIPTQNTNFRSTVASRLYQLGIGLGSPFPKRVYYIDGNSKPTNEDYNWVTPTSAFDKGVKTPHTGFHAGNTYVKIGDKFKGFLAATYNSNSPIDELYKKYNLQDAANSDTSTSPYSSYIRQPFIERGIQRKGKESPQRWGIGNFDDGLIRGGITAAVEIAAVDTARIAKWMSTPKGLLWIVKQIGLGLTNPKVQATGNWLTRQTRIHPGINSLLSVAGTAFGLHFTRHGIPFRNDRASYGSVVTTRQPTDLNRLSLLREEFGGTGKVYSSKVLNLLSNLKVIATKSFGSFELSGWGGPQSAYGIGFTQIRRVVDTKTEAIRNAMTSRFVVNGYTPGQSYNKPYAKFLKARTGNIYDTGENLTIDFESSPADKMADILAPDSGSSLTLVDNRSNIKDSLRVINDTFNAVDPGTGLYIESAGTNGIWFGKSIATGDQRQHSYPTAPLNSIDRYYTLTYQQIPNSRNRSGSFNDFRESIKFPGSAAEADETGQSGARGPARGILGARPKGYYTDNNLEIKYGFGKLGEVGKDLSNPNEFLQSGSFIDKESLKNPANRHILSSKDKFRGDRITAINVISDQIPTSDIYPENTSDLIKFYFEDGKEGVNVMPFRCTMVSLTDNFSPGWDKVDIMGRPDGAYIYTSFERSISFNFIVAALSRSEMIPMWRKLNKLATYTMPNFDGKNGRPSGPLMRISIGNLFQRTPGFITSLTYTIPDDATWDIGEDISEANRTPKQLPMMVDASVTYTIVGDFRPQLNGRVYSLQHLGGAARDKGDWIPDAKTTSPPIVAEDPTKTAQADKISADSSAKKSFNDRARAGEPIGPLGLTY